MAILRYGRFLGRGDGVSSWEFAVPNEFDPATRHVRFRVSIEVSFGLGRHGRHHRREGVAVAVCRSQSGVLLRPLDRYCNGKHRRRNACAVFCDDTGMRTVMLSYSNGAERNIWICEHELGEPMFPTVRSESRDAGSRFVIRLEQRTPFFGPVSGLPSECLPWHTSARLALKNGVTMSFEEADDFLETMRPFASWQTAP